MNNKVLINNVMGEFAKCESNVMGEFAKCESNIKELINNSAPAQVYVRDGVEYKGYKAYVKGLKKEVKRVENLKTQAEAIKAAAIAEGDYENMERLNVNIGNFQSKIDRLNIELGKKAALKKADAAKIVDGINADTFKGIVYEICKTFNGVFEVGDVYAYAETFAAKYPGFNRSGEFGDNILNGIRTSIEVLTNKDGLLERLGWNAYRVANKATSKGVIYETAG